MANFLTIFSGQRPQDFDSETTEQNSFHQIYLARISQPRREGPAENFTRQNLSELLTSFKGSECSDRRDEIISLLGLSKEAQADVPARFVADYVSLPKLYFRALHAWMSTGGELTTSADYYATPLRKGTSLTLAEIAAAILEILGPDERLLCPFDWIVGTHLCEVDNIVTLDKIYDYEIDLCDYCKKAAIKIDVERLATGSVKLAEPDAPAFSERGLFSFDDQYRVTQLFLRRPGEGIHQKNLRMRQIVEKQVQ